MLELDFIPTIPNMTRSLAATYSDRALLLQGSDSLSYDEAQRRSAALAKALLARGMGKGMRVGVLFPNGADWLIAWLACSRIGAVVVPINTLFTPRELLWVLGHADIGTLLTVDRYLKHDYLAKLEEAIPALDHAVSPRLALEELPYLQSVIVWGESGRRWTEPAATLADGAAWRRINDIQLRAAEDSVMPVDHALVIYTSGSTAEPKGVLHSQGNMVRQAFALRPYWIREEAARVCSPQPWFWIGGMLMGMFLPMAGGATAVLAETPDPSDALKALSRHKVTTIMGVKQLLVSLRAQPEFAHTDLSHIKYGLHPPRNADGSFVEPARIPDSLGMSETFGPHSGNLYGDPLDKPSPGSCGYIHPHFEHKIVDTETGADLPRGKEGELCVRGGSLMVGYYKRERSECFDRDGWFHTGDKIRLMPDGEIVYLARLDDTFKVSGANVSPAEVEFVLNGVAGVIESTVIALPHPDLGNEVIAVLVLEPGANVTEALLRQRAQAELAAYKRPRRIVIMDYEAMPRTPARKVIRWKLRHMLRQRQAPEKE